MLTLFEFWIGLVYSLVSIYIYILNIVFFSKCFSSGSDLRDYYKQMKGVKKSTIWIEWNNFRVECRTRWNKPQMKCELRLKEPKEKYIIKTIIWRIKVDQKENKNWTEPFDSLTTHNAIRHYHRRAHSSWRRRSAACPICSSPPRTGSGTWTRRAVQWMVDPARSPVSQSKRCESPASIA